MTVGRGSDAATNADKTRGSVWQGLNVEREIRHEDGGAVDEVDKSDRGSKDNRGTTANHLDVRGADHVDKDGRRAIGTGSRRCERSVRQSVCVCACRDRTRGGWWFALDDKHVSPNVNHYRSSHAYLPTPSHQHHTHTMYAYIPTP